LEFLEGTQQVHLQGIQQEPPNISTITPEQFVKWQSGNDIWALAVIQPAASHLVTEEIPTPIDTVSNEF
jgi:hypothetical protein